MTWLFDFYILFHFLTSLFSLKDPRFSLVNRIGAFSYPYAKKAQLMLCRFFILQ